MATRFYLGNTTPDTSITPNMSGSWNVTTGFDRMLANIVKDGTAMATKTSAATGAASPRAVGVRQFISKQLIAQTFSSGNFDTAGLMRSSISSTASSSAGRPRMIIRVCSSDGSTIRGTLIDVDLTISGNFSTTLTTRGNDAGSTTAGWSAVSAQDNDRLLIEIGWSYTAGTNTTRTADFSFGGNAASDLVAASGTTANNPWIELPHTVLFKIPNKIYQLNQSVNRANSY